MNISGSAWVRATLSAQALQHNLQCARVAAPGCQLLAIIKANAYGHGLVQVAEIAAKNVDGFGVGRLEEALVLRAAGCDQPIVLLGGFLEAKELAPISHFALQPVLYTQQQLHQLEQAKLSSPLTLWLKIDTGMHRLGFPWEEAKSHYKRLQRCHNVAGIYLISHLANSDHPAHVNNLQQIKCFQKVAATLKVHSSLANSGGVLAFPQSHFHWIRPGIMLYGVSPFRNRTAQQENLLPVMHFHSRLLAVQALKKGDTIGYGNSWTCPEDMPVGIVAGGYGDGYPRHASEGTPVLVQKQRTPLIGRVSMDYLYVDLRNIPQAQIGAPVTLWGDNLPVEEIARQSGTIAYQLVCGVAPRVVRQWV